MLEIPPGLRPLFDAAGPVIRYRLLRDVMDRDDSYIDTANLGLDLARLPEIAALVDAQQPDGTWNGLLSIPPSRTRSGITGGVGGVASSASGHTTESALLRLCELGRETSVAVGICVEKVLLPTLFNEHVLWEFAGPDDANYRRAARHVVRDKVLRLICRATRETDPVIKPYLETILAEWDLFLSTAGTAEAVTIAPPTADAYAAVCWYPWPDDDLERVHALVKRLFDHAESRLPDSPPLNPSHLDSSPLNPPPFTGGLGGGAGAAGASGNVSDSGFEFRISNFPPSSLPLFTSHVFQLHEKWDYLARPHVMLHDLELAARLGIVRDTLATSWMLEELEAHQDADGLFRFDAADVAVADWYFPLEAVTEEAYSIEWSFRAALIVKLLAYDL